WSLGYVDQLRPPACPTRRSSDLLALGELPTRRGSGPMSFPPIRWLVIDVVTWPHGTKGPPEAFKTQPAVWSRDVASLGALLERLDRKSTRLNSSHQIISYAVFCL